jgi:ATP-dependent DNA helicase PIF1
MTINKSQGQSFKTVGIDLRHEVFSHGQFYIAVSRTSSVANLHILPTFIEKMETVNQSFPEVLTNLNNV